MFAIKRSDCVWTAGLYYISRAVKPETDMISLDRIGCWVLRGIRYGAGFVKRVCRRGRNIGRDNKSLDTEAAYKLARASAIRVGFNVPLIPRQPKRCIGYLNYEQIEVGIRRQAFNFYLHDFDWSDETDGHSAVSLRRNCRETG